METRTKATAIRFSDEELEMLKAIAKAKGLNQSDVLRQYIRREYEKLAKKGPALR